MGSAEDPSDIDVESVQREPLDEHDLPTLRSHDTGATRLTLIIDGALMVLAVIVVAVTPAMHSFWPIFGLGIALLAGAAFMVAMFVKSKDVRADLSAGVKHWCSGTVTSLWIHTGAEAGETPTYHLEIALNGDGEPRTLSSSISAMCYETVEPRDRVRVAYAPRSHVLLNLVDGDYEYAA